jgi:PiT family inorganic phosphate transporter
MLTEKSYVFLALACIGAFFMAFCNGSNDAANAFAPAVGSKALRMRTALFIASVVTFFGAVSLGGRVVLYLIDGLAPVQVFPSHDHYIIAMLSVLLSAGLFVLASSVMGLSVSSTHAIVGALTGVSFSVQGLKGICWPILKTIALSWLVSPLLAGGMAWLLIYAVRHYILGQGGPGTLYRLKKGLSLLLSFTIAAVFFGFLVYNESPETQFFRDHIRYACLLSLLLVIPFYFQAKLFIHRWFLKTSDDQAGAEKLFKRLQVVTSAYVAFGNGANDVSNSITPVVAIYLILKTGTLHFLPGQEASIPFWILALGGVGFATGVSVLGKNVMETMGKKITRIDNPSGFCIDFAVASVVVSASVLGLPVSTSQAATGGIIGCGLSHGRAGDVHFGVVARILVAWVVTVPVSACFTLGVYKTALWFLL